LDRLPASITCARTGLVLVARSRRLAEHAIDRLGVALDADDLAHRRGEARVDLLADAEVRARLGGEHRAAVEQHRLAVQRAGQPATGAGGGQVLQVAGHALVGGAAVQPRIVGQAALPRHLRDQPLEASDAVGLGRLVDAVDRLHQLGRAALQEAAAERVAQDADLLVGQLDRGARRARHHQLAGGVEPHRGLGAQVAHHLGAVLVLAAQLAERGDRQQARDRSRAGPGTLALTVDERLRPPSKVSLAAAAHPGALEAGTW
jgi:hypothetical protein